MSINYHQSEFPEPTEYDVGCVTKYYRLAILLPLLDLILELVVFYFTGFVTKKEECAVGVGVTTGLSFVLLALGAGWIIYTSYSPMDLLKLYAGCGATLMVMGTITATSSNTPGCALASASVGLGAAGVLLGVYALMAFSIVVCCTDSLVSIRGRGGYSEI